MIKTQLVAAAAIAVMLLSGAEPAAALVNTFTSGGPPIGDGNDYPRSLNPSQQSGGGASVDTFFTDLVGYTNSSGNPAFFDSNNLLTRPAALINGDAFWTDPRVGNFVGPSGNPFSIAQIGFEFFDANFESFGFDIAVASASGSVPESLPFQIQDFDSDAFGFGSFILDPDAGGDGFDIGPDDAGTFFTLGGRQGREARYRIDRSTIEDILFEPLSGGTWFLDIDLESIATLGGTTQVAIDNFVFDGADLPMPTEEPVFLPPTPPIGPNRPQYFNYASTSDDQSDGDSYDFTETDLTDEQVTITFTGLLAAEDTSEARSEGSTVTFDGSAIEDGLQSHELTQLMEEVLDGVDEELGRRVGPGFELDNVFDGGIRADIPGQLLEVRTRLGTDDQQAIDQAAEQFDKPQSILDPNDVNQGFTNVVEPFDSPSQNIAFLEAPLPTEAESFVVGLMTSEPQFYENYTVSDYLSLKQSLGEPLIEGDAGSFVTPVAGDNGAPLTYIVSTWTVSAQGGVFIPVLLGAAIPEPASAVAALIGCLAAGRRRSR